MRPPFSIWIVPPEDVRRRLDGLVGRHGEGPAFTPHVTLLGDVRSDPEATLDAAREVARHFLPLTIRFDGVDTGTSFFRSVFLRVRAGADLRRAHRVSSEALERAPDPDFDPHLSLAYGHVPPPELAVLRAQVDRRGIPGTCFEADALTVVHAASTVPIDEWVEIETIVVNRSP